MLNWTVEDVVKWMHKYAGVEGEKYAALFEDNKINGMCYIFLQLFKLGYCLRMMTDEWLIRIGISDSSERYYKDIE